MKTMSKKDFDRLSKKKGFSVKLKKGIEKLPKSAAEAVVPLSGESVVDAPALASPPEFYALMDRMASVLERLDVPKAIPKAKPGVLSVAANEAKTVADKQEMIDRAIASIELTRVESVEPVEKFRTLTSWTTTINRSAKKGWIDSVESVAEDGTEWTHKYLRSEKKGLIAEIRSVSNDGVEVQHLIHRDNQLLISDVTSTPL